MRLTLYGSVASGELWHKMIKKDEYIMMLWQICEGRVDMNEYGSNQCEEGRKENERLFDF